MPLEASTTESIDLLTELRLRRWARENYVSALKREADWHPVILDEMRAKEQELSSESRGRCTVSAYVPLAPEPVSTDWLDEAHAAPRAPLLLAALQRFDVYIQG